MIDLTKNAKRAKEDTGEEEITEDKKSNIGKKGCLSQGQIAVRKEIKKGKIYSDAQSYVVYRFGFLNVNGIKVSSLPDLEEEWKENDLDIIALVETHIRGESTWEGKYYKMEGKGRNLNTKQGGGAAILIRKGLNWNIEEIKPEHRPPEDIQNQQTEIKYEEDIKTYRLIHKKEKQEHIILIVCYITTGKTREIIEENKTKYKCIKRQLEKYKKEKILVMGDMNAHIGILGEKIDKNGQLLLDLVEDKELEIGNLTIAEGKITWERPGGKEKSAIDYILYNDRIKP